MDFEFNLLEVSAAAAAAYTALRLEVAWRRWSARRSWKPNPSHTISKIKEVGRTVGAAEAIKCGNCGTKTKDFQKYTDGDRWCLSCDATEE